MTARDPDLRQAVLAAVVLFDLPAVPADEGILIEGRVVDWRHVESALNGHDAGTPAGRVAVAEFLVAVCRLAAIPTAEVKYRIRPLGLPVGHSLHPGPRWVRAAVLGGAIDVGFGVIGLGEDPDQVDVLHPGAAEALGHIPLLWWRQARRYLEEMGAVAADRQRRNPDEPLRPMGDCDVVTLLASAILRSTLCRGKVMRTAAVPMRRRGWLDLNRTDPAFALAAAAAADDEDRGFLRPVLITWDEVALAKPGGDPLRLILADPAAPDPRPTTVPYL